VARRLLLPAGLFAWLIPSVETWYRAAGAAGALAWLVGGLGLLWIAERLASGVARRGDGERTASVAVVVILALVAAAIVIAYPRVNVHTPGHGGDRDDALDHAVSALAHGRYPYAERTYLDNPITPLPGAVLLSVPSLLLGGVAYLNIAWLVLFVATLAARREGRGPPLFALLGLLASPGTLKELAVGGDLVANGIYVLAALTLYLSAVERGRGLAVGLAAIPLGLAIASRVNFVLVLLPATAFATRRSGPGIALLGATVAALVCAIVTVPFLLHAPGPFPPLHVYHQYDQVVPHAGMLMATVGLGIAAALSLSTLVDDVVGTLAAATLTAIAPLVVAAAVALGLGRPHASVNLVGRTLCATPIAMAVIAARRLGQKREGLGHG
jgi:hypothetical protein